MEAPKFWKNKTSLIFNMKYFTLSWSFLSYGNSVMETPDMMYTRGVTWMVCFQWELTGFLVFSCKSLE